MAQRDQNTTCETSMRHIGHPRLQCFAAGLVLDIPNACLESFSSLYILETVGTRDLSIAVVSEWPKYPDFISFSATKTPFQDPQWAIYSSGGGNKASSARGKGLTKLRNLLTVTTCSTTPHMTPGPI